jgi:hypothetical protein
LIQALQPKPDFIVSPLKTQIESWCLANGVTVPSGFHRHTASRYVAIDTAQTPFKLVARTWFSLKDLEYYLENVGASDSYRALDFKERCELIRSNTGRLSRGDAF